MDVTKIDPKLANTAINTIRFLSVDAVEKANSGHPGLPMGTADIAFTLWMEFLRFNPKDPQWHNRDRFILSAGHGSALLYSLLHVFGFDLSMDDLKQFRQWDSKTPGHPEFGHTAGVETTTGPLGHGFANGVGMALQERYLASKFDGLIDNYIYGIVSDGDLMEGVSAEAASVAGHLGLGKLIYVYDDNNITIEGNTSLAFTEDVSKRFESYNWHVQKVDGYDLNAVRQALVAAQNEKDKPSIIIAKTNIGKGSPNKQDKASAHGEPLGADEVKLTKENMGWPADKSFYVPEEAQQLFQQRVDELKADYDAWQKKFQSANKGDWDAVFNRTVPADLGEKLMATIKKDSIATRAASGDMIQVVSQEVPALLGGSADLAPSTKTDIKGSASFQKGSYNGKNIHFGIREHAMGAMMNGMAVYGGCIPYGSTFLVFSDFVRPAVRISALMGVQAIYIFTHDSIFVGEDGPTHEPVEHVSSLRLIPNLLVLRPSDATETAAAWEAALAHKNGPTAMILTRQNLPTLDRNKYAKASELNKGAYILKEANGGAPDMVIAASGSEVSLALEAADEIEKKGKKVQVVSAPSLELFEKQDKGYQDKVFPMNGAKMVAVEAGSTQGWYKYVGREGLVIGIDRFGASAPYAALAKNFGFNTEDVVKKISEKFSI